MSIYDEKEEWLKQSVNSILNQTQEDLEFIIINDNPDSNFNKSFLETYERMDSRIRVLHNEINIGLTKSLNRGLIISKGKYIARMDADDISFPNRLELQSQFLEENGEYVLVGAQAIKVDEDNKEIGELTYNTKDDVLRVDMLSFNPFIHPLLMFRTSTIADNQLVYDEQFRYSQDFRFIFEICKHGKIGNLDEVLLQYRVSRTQISRSKFSEQNAFFIRTRDDILRYELRNFSENIKVNQDLDETILLLNEMYPKSKLFSKMLYSILVYPNSLSKKVAFKAVFFVFGWNFIERMKVLYKLIFNK